MQVKMGLFCTFNSVLNLEVRALILNKGIKSNLRSVRCISHKFIEISHNSVICNENVITNSVLKSESFARDVDLFING